ncbi:MAG: phosphoglycerate dehydrogenase [Actinomycetota bacterium]
MTRVAVTCLQLLRDLEQHRAPLDDRSWDVVPAHVPGQHLEGDALVDAMRDCVGVVAGDDQFTADVLAQLPTLRVISKWGIGIDGIDLEAAERHGIVVRNTPGMFNDEVADITMAYITIVVRRLVDIDRGVRAGSWPKPPGRSLQSLTLGIVGLGAIGRATAVRALAAGMPTVGTDPSPESREAATAMGVQCVDLDELLAKSDVIAINAPLNAATHHLIDEAAFDAMREGVYLVNTGRGAVVSNDALVAALDVGKVTACALDVMEHEPPPLDDPLRQFDNVVFGSHNASNTLDASARVSDVAIANLIEELERS